MGMIMKLGQLSVNETGIITKVNADSRFKERLHSLGFIKNNSVKLIMHGRKKEISVYEIYNGLVALRKEDAELIEVDVR